ncbi:MAG: response regulator [Rhodospirillales bacterium]|jgi:DNA-binding response OmpR family regulator|nr:response regulator [Rhodospirillales bacterium]MDP7098800.1 response regulator [Rhodospirillales bacterium]MDP7215474.1 response regulator [Rhodospirillales bacterium]HIJ92183.1 response regulator [Rhodospirillaceae bacterium]HJP53260.1 response regulator [Rhodospirillales bacterium]
MSCTHLASYHIETARDGGSGFTVGRKTSPHVILTEWAMSPMSGLEFIKEVRTNKRYPNPYVAVIMLTSYCERHHVIEARDAGVNEFLVKPISVKALYDRIVEVIEFSRSYVISPSFTGPCRRRSPDSGYIGLGRRQADREKEETAAAARVKAEEEAAAMSQDEVASKLGKKTDNWRGGPR